MFGIVRRIGLCIVTTMAMKAVDSLWDNLFEDKMRKLTEHLRKRKDAKES